MSAIFKAVLLLITILTCCCNCQEIVPPKKPSERSIRIRANVQGPRTSTAADKIKDKPVVFPEDDDVSGVPETIPESLLIQMRDFKKVEDFLNFVGLPRDNYSPMAGPGYNGSQEEGVYINGSDGDSTSGVSERRKPLAATITKGLAEAAGCEIEMQAVELEKPEDPTVVIWPMCTRLPRCGGCCTSSQLECVPTKVSKSKIKVIKARYTGKPGGQFQITGMVDQNVEKHEKCECQCKQKPEHCTALQSYKIEECKCVCTNDLLRKSCVGRDHIWDFKECVCKCRQTRECSSGFFYSMDSCKCEVAARSSRIGSPEIGSRRGRPNLPTLASTSTSVPSGSRWQGVGDFGQPMAHLNAGERSKLDREVRVNIKPYDMEPFTLAQTRKDSRGRPVVRVVPEESEKRGRV